MQKDKMKNKPFELLPVGSLRSTGGAEGAGVQRGGDQGHVQAAVRGPAVGKHRVYDGGRCADHHQARSVAVQESHVGGRQWCSGVKLLSACGPVVTNASELLGLDAFQLSEVLTQRSIILRGEEICSPLTIEQVGHGPCDSSRKISSCSTLTPPPPLLPQAVDSRDSVAMALYSQCFSWIILKINQKIKGKENFKSIGILDIFGFENFEVRAARSFAGKGWNQRCVCQTDGCLCLQVNRFEQFNINYANEKLQEYFNKHIFSLEQLEYNRCTFPEPNTHTHTYT